MTQLRTSMIIDLAGNLAGRAQQYLSSMQRLGSGGARSMQLLRGSVNAVGAGLDKLGNRYTALLTGGGLALQVKEVGDLSERFTRLGINSQTSANDIDRLKAKIFAISQAPDIRVDPGEMTAAVEQIVQKLGDLKLADEQLRNIGVTIRTTGAAGRDVGDLIANMAEKFEIRGTKNMLTAIDTLILQGKAGAFEMRDLVTQGNRVTAMYGAMGRKGLPAVKEMGAALQVFRKAAASPEETSTAFKDFFADLMEPERMKILKANKIEIWDPEALKRGKKQVRSIVDITDELMRKSKGDPEKLGRVLGRQTLDGFRAVISEYQSTGKNPMHDFLKVEGDGTEVLKDSARAAREFNAAVTNLHTAVKQFASTNLTKPIQQVADFMNGLGPEKTQQYLNNAKRIGLALGGLILARKGYNIYQALFGGKGGGLPGGGLGRGLSGPVPVYVVNKHLSLMPGEWMGKGGGGFAGGTVPGSKPTLAKTPIALGTAGVMALPAISAAMSRPAGKYLAEKEVKATPTNALQELRVRHIVMGGGPNAFQVKLIDRELASRGVQPATAVPVKSPPLQPAHTPRQRPLAPPVVNLPAMKPAPVVSPRVPVHKPISVILPQVPAYKPAAPAQPLPTTPAAARPRADLFDTLLRPVVVKPTAAAQPEPKPAKVGGKVTIEVLSDMPTRVRELRSDNKDVGLDVFSGLTMRGF